MDQAMQLAFNLAVFFIGLNAVTLIPRAIRSREEA